MSIIYDWAGTCTNGCSGTATAELVLPDTWTPGTLPDCQYCADVGVFYFDSEARFGPPDRPQYNYTDIRVDKLELPLTAGPGAVQIVRGAIYDNRFVFGPDGSWVTKFELTADLGHFAQGVGGEFTRLDAPSTLPLVLLALGILWLTRRYSTYALAEEAELLRGGTKFSIALRTLDRMPAKKKPTS